jgi:hypothetical protein
LNDFGYRYQTIYVNPDLLSYYNNGKKVTGLQRVIQSEEIASLFGLHFNNEKIVFNAAEKIIKGL